MKDLSPKKIFQEVAEAVPRRYHNNIVIVGSLAAAYHFLHHDEGQAVRTKDID